MVLYHHHQELPPSILEYSRNMVVAAHGPRIKAVKTADKMVIMESGTCSTGMSTGPFIIRKTMLSLKDLCA